MIHNWDRRREGSADWNAIAITIRYYPWRGERRHCDPLCVSRLLDRPTREEEREREWKEGIRETEGRIPSFTLHSWPRRDSVPKIRLDVSNRRCRLVDAEFRLIKNRRISNEMLSNERIVNESESWNRGGNFIEPFRSGRIELGRGKQGGGRGEEATSKYIHHAASIILQRMLVIEGNVGFRSSDSRHPTPITCYRSRNHERRIDTWFRFS